MTNIGTQLTIEREKTHGSFAENALYYDTLTDLVHKSGGWNKATSIQRNAMDMICLKFSRICSGQPSFLGHWEDISGYAELVCQALTTGVTNAASQPGHKELKRPAAIFSGDSEECSDAPALSKRDR